jgi:hypothetical protein
MNKHKRKTSGELTKNHYIFIVVAIAISFALIGITVKSYLTINSNKITISSKISKAQIILPKYVAAVGDITCDPTEPSSNGLDATKCQDAKVADAIGVFEPDKLLLLGDLQYNTGSYEKFQQAYNVRWSKYLPISLPSPGNHEYETKGATGYFDNFNGTNVTTGIAGSRGQGYYHTSIGDWSVYSLNSNCKDIGGCEPGSLQYAWLESELTKDAAICKLAYWHHPIFSSSKHGVDVADTSRMVKVWDLLQKYKTSIVLNGHDHVYERFALQNSTGQADTMGIRQFTVGTGGKDLYAKVTNKPNSEFFENTSFGYLELTLGVNKYDWNFNTIAGQVLDQGEGSCSS